MGSTAEWHQGIVHAHTSYSDGLLTPGELAEKVGEQGCRFIIITDHYDMIPEAVKGRTALSLALAAMAGPGSPDGLRPRWGFASYSQEITALCREGEFVAIPGAEIGARWEPEPGNEASAHTLALGVIREADSQVLDQYCEKPGRQQDVINKILQWGMVPVAAHPSFLHNGRSGRLSYTGRIDYRYDKRPADQVSEVQYRGLAGVEMFNTDGSGQTQEDIDFYLRLLREGYSPFVTSGCDYHGYGDESKLSRRTWVYTESLTTEGILEAIRRGRTYAADYGAELVSMSPMPGEHVAAERATINATVAFPEPTGSPKEFVVYRDGIEAAGSRQTKSAGQDSYDYEWTDPLADGAEHSYVLRVAEVLVTSPAHMASSRPSSLASPAIAFIREGNIWLMDIEGGHQLRLTTSGDCSSPSWCPDGMKLVYVRGERWDNRALWVIDVTRRTASRLTSGVDDYQCPRWSPNGQWVACFCTHEEANIEDEQQPNKIVVIDAQTGGVRPLNNEPLYVGTSLAWSPDSASLAYSDGCVGTASLSVVAVSNGRVINRDLYGIVTETDSAVINGLVWSTPSRITFFENANTGDAQRLAIRQIDLSGTARTLLSREDRSTVGFIGWVVSPIDDTSLVVSMDSYWPWSDASVWLLQSGQLTKLADDAADACCSPSGSSGAVQLYP